MSKVEAEKKKLRKLIRDSLFRKFKDSEVYTGSDVKKTISELLD